MASIEALYLAEEQLESLLTHFDTTDLNEDVPALDVNEDVVGIREHLAVTPIGALSLSLAVDDCSREEPLVPKTVSMASPLSYQDSFRNLRRVLKSDKTPWSERCSAMDTFTEVLKLCPDQCSTLLTDIVSIRTSIRNQVEDARSAVVRSSCRLIATFASLLTSKFQDLAVFFLPILLSRLYVTVKVISSSSDQCIKSVLEAVKPSPKLVPKLVKALSDTHSAVRQSTCTYISIVLDGCKRCDEDIQIYADHLSVAVLSAAKDADGDVRRLARVALRSFVECFPSHHSSFGIAADDDKYPNRDRLSGEIENRSNFSNLLD